MKHFVILAVLGLSLTACTTTPPPPPPIVTGNGGCHPSPDLPAHKVMKKVPEVDTLWEDLYDLFLVERKAHHKDIEDYNSLYDTCVNGVKK